MPNPDKTFWWHMHQKTSYEFNTGKSQFFPLSFVPVIFYRKSYGFIIHADDAVIADSNPMGILSKVINHRLCAVKSFLTIRDPFRIITGIKQFFERIMVTVFFSSSMKLKLIRIPKIFQLLHIFSTEDFGDSPYGKKKLRTVSLTVIRKYLQQLTSTLTNRVLKEGISYVTKFKISSFLLTNMIHEVQKILYYYLLTNISGQISFFYYIFKYSSNIIHSSPYFTNLLYFH